MNTALTVGELRVAMDGLSDDMNIVVVNTEPASKDPFHEYWPQSASVVSHFHGEPIGRGGKSLVLTTEGVAWQTAEELAAEDARDAVRRAERDGMQSWIDNRTQRNGCLYVGKSDGYWVGVFFVGSSFYIRKICDAVPFYLSYKSKWSPQAYPDAMFSYASAVDAVIAAEAACDTLFRTKVTQ